MLIEISLVVLILLFLVFAWFHPADFHLHQRRMAMFTSKRPLRWLPMSQLKPKDEFGVIIVRDVRFDLSLRYKVLAFSGGSWMELHSGSRVRYFTGTMRINNAQWRRLE